MAERETTTWRSVPATDTGAPATGTSVPATDTKKRSGRGLITNLITLALTVAIITAGFFSPSLMAPVMDSYRGQTVLLEPARSDEVALHLFADPVSLYPWNLYSEQSTRSLNYAERDFLFERGVPDFLLATLASRGHDVRNLPAQQYDQLLAGAFSYLATEGESTPGCYLLPDTDLNEDGTADVRAAVDLGGNVISLIILSDSWPEAEEAAPEGGEQTGPANGARLGEVPLVTGTDPNTGANADPSAASGAASNADPSAASGADVPLATGEGNPVASDAAPDATLGAAGSSGSAGALGSAGTSGTGTASATGGNSTKFDTTLLPGQTSPLQEIEREQRPVGIELSLWGFVNMLAVNAQAHRQQQVLSASALLDKGFMVRYGYSFAALFGDTTGSPTEAGADVSVNASATTSAVGVGANADAGTEAGPNTSANGGAQAGADTSGGAQAGTDASANDSSAAYNPIPTIFGTEEYDLYIYDLPNDMRLILYLNPLSQRCLGYSLQLP